MSLYRTYRPKTFADVVGQRHVVEILTQAIKQNKVTHAYLFQGPRGTGKTTLARLLAMRVNCTQSSGVEPCGLCSSCTGLLAGSSLDIIEIDAASNRGIDDIRQLRETMATAPTGGRKKVYIIDEVHMLTNEAFAALLKTLEEPSPHALFVLATTELHKVPETILSRCQVFRFRRATDDELRGRLTYILKQEKQTLPDDMLSFIIGRSDGCFRDAESLLGQILTLSSKNPSIHETLELLGIPNPKTINEFIASLEQKNAAAAIAIAEQAYEHGYDPELFVEETIRTARDRAVAYAKAGQVGSNLPAIIRAFIQAKQDLAYVPQPLIALELAILTAAGGSAPVSPLLSKKRVKGEVLSLEQVQSAWPQIIQRVKDKNPAASTFLRAMTAEAISGDVVTIRAQYGLHRNFFEKDANRHMLLEVLKQELRTSLSVRIRLDEQKPATAIPTIRRTQETELLNNVKEIFGAK